MSYADFIARKQGRVEKPGREVTAADIHPMLSKSGGPKILNNLRCAPASASLNGMRPLSNCSGPTCLSRSRCGPYRVMWSMLAI